MLLPVEENVHGAGLKQSELIWRNLRHPAWHDSLGRTEFL